MEQAICKIVLESAVITAEAPGVMVNFDEALALQGGLGFVCSAEQANLIGIALIAVAKAHGVGS